jgi:hypothetical protein
VSGTATAAAAATTNERKNERTTTNLGGQAVSLELRVTDAPRGLDAAGEPLLSVCGRHDLAPATSEE